MLEAESGDEGGSAARNDKNDYDAADGRACKGGDEEKIGNLGPKWRLKIIRSGPRMHTQSRQRKTFTESGLLEAICGDFCNSEFILSEFAKVCREQVLYVEVKVRI